VRINFKACAPRSKLVRIMARIIFNVAVERKKYARINLIVTTSNWVEQVLLKSLL